MQVLRKSCLAGAADAEGLTVVIDVLRAFTTAAVLFHYGIKQLYLVREVEEAQAIQAEQPDVLLAGEVYGRLIPGFDLGNSPTAILQRGPDFFAGRTVVQRTSAGTQGVVLALGRVDRVILGSFMMAGAIARFIQAQNPAVVSLIGMGRSATLPSTEDETCAAYLDHLLTGTAYDPLATVWANLTDEDTAATLRGEHDFKPPEDVVLALQRDLFDFVLVAQREGDHIVARRVAD